MTKIITHRGLEPAQENYYSESSLESFIDQLKRGYGLEFDIQFTKDGEAVISHDSNLKRISKNKVDNNIKDLTLEEILSFDFNGCHLTYLGNLLDLIKEYGSNSLSSLHLKHNNQDRDSLDMFLQRIAEYDLKNIVIFDVKIETAKYLKEKRPDLDFAPSVVHPYDLERYNDCVGNTLYTLDQAKDNCDLFDWVWLDEWDLSDRRSNSKTLYNEEVFNQAREAGFKILLASPELHASSPGLLGGESHQDAASLEILEKRMKQIVSLKPDGVCTDYPEMYKKIIK